MTTCMKKNKEFMFEYYKLTKCINSKLSNLCYCLDTSTWFNE